MPIRPRVARPGGPSSRGLHYSHGPESSSPRRQKVGNGGAIIEGPEAAIFHCLIQVAGQLPLPVTWLCLIPLKH